MDQRRNETYAEIMEMWEENYYAYRKQECPQMPRCKRSIYKLAIKPNMYVSHSSYGAALKIQLDSPNVYTMEDSIAYDLQSLIGEVGGTLGLFLGLSTMSFIDLIEFIFQKLFS